MCTMTRGDIDLGVIEDHASAAWDKLAPLASHWSLELIGRIEDALLQQACTAAGVTLAQYRTAVAAALWRETQGCSAVSAALWHFCR